jgi:hypothetical protein
MWTSMDGKFKPNNRDLQSRPTCILKKTINVGIPVKVSSCKGNLPIKDPLSKACGIT